MLAHVRTYGNCPFTRPKKCPFLFAKKWMVVEIGTLFNFSAPSCDNENIYFHLILEKNVHSILVR